MDVALYQDLKTKGAATLQRLGVDTFQLLVKKFDQHTGKELAPEVNPCTKQSVESLVENADAQLVIAQKQRDAAKALLDDMAALEATATP